MSTQRFWTRSYDEGVGDLDPSAWETTYVEALKPTIEAHPDKAALSFMGVEVTFAELDRLSNRFARLLTASGISKGDVVGINLPNIPEYLIAWLGTLKAGCAVSGVSPLMSAEEMHYQLTDCGARALVTLDAIYEKRLVSVAPRLEKLELVVAASVGGFLPPLKRFLGKLLKKIPKGRLSPLEGKKVYRFKEVIAEGRFSSNPPEVDISPGDVAYVQYTGGTTGSPKGARLTHRNVVSDLLIVQHWLGWEKGEGIALSCFPLFHIAGLFFAENCVYLGWTQILVPNPRDTDYVCKQLAKYRPTVMANVPSLYHMLIANPAFAGLDHSRLEYCISAAAPFPEESQKELEEIVGKGKLLEVYGMSETSPLTTMNPSKGPKKLGSIGLPLPNTELKLVDPASGDEVGPGQPGEICVKGPQVMAGYHEKPGETEAAIDEEGFMHTGDVAIMDEEGYLRIVDRTKDMIIVSGFKVFSKRVEEVLSEHPAVRLIALVGVANPERPGSELVKAFIQLDPEGTSTGDREQLEKDIIAFGREKLAPYEIPKLIEFVDELPLTVIGKIDKKKLR